MGKCETCGNDYDKAFTVILKNIEHTFDCFECAIQSLAPTCFHCRTKIIGHGVETHGVMYCSAHCARENGEIGLTDRQYIA